MSPWEEAGDGQSSLASGTKGFSHLGVPKCLKVKIFNGGRLPQLAILPNEVTAKGIGIFPDKLQQRAVFEKMARQDWKMAPLPAPKYEKERSQHRIVPT